MSGPQFEKAVDRIRDGDIAVLVVASGDILTVPEVLSIVDAGGKVAFAREDVVLGRVQVDDS